MMSKITWENIEEILRKNRAQNCCQDADVFWRDFKENVQEIKQEETEEISSLLPFSGIWLKFAACFVLLISLAIFIVREGNETAVLTKTEVKRIEVYGGYSAMIILDDIEGEGTIVWVADMNVNEKVDSL